MFPGGGGNICQDWSTNMQLRNICAQWTMVQKVNNINTNPGLPVKLLSIYSVVETVHVSYVHRIFLASDII
jgi:hypothetical protein